MPHLLQAIADPARPRVPAHDLAVVVAHPDDETVGCGALLPRLEGATLVMVTDGAPRNLADATAYGFSSAQEYAAARTCELQRALGIVGVPESALVRLGIPDQQAAFNLKPIAERLVDVLVQRRIGIVLTHAYEGGHPDHDAVAFTVHAARRLLQWRGQSLGILEMPLYRGGPDGILAHSFSPRAGVQETVVRLNTEEQALKRRLIEAHATQARVLSLFSTEAERFRVAPDYDFGALPNGGDVFYDRHDWGVSSRRFLELAAAASHALEWTPAPCA